MEGLSQEVLNCFMAYDWPGNVRELEHLLERLVILAENSVIPRESLPVEFLIEGTFKNLSPLKEALHEFEQRYIGAILQKTGGNRGETADLLGIHRSTLALKIQQWGLGPPAP